MAFTVSMLILAAFLSGVAAAVFIVLVIGIHAGDRASHLADEPCGRLDALARSALGVGIRAGKPTGISDAERK
ncbi:MAG TPA: hypothetical protein VKU39_21945 [Streptosporangiaceae bacterium]|nr:hypothetical protein [Streptosporangiaceae bacterium]